MKKQRVLLVDDNVKFLQAANDMINSKNNAVVVGWEYSGEAAVNKIAVQHPDLVLMDISMPGIGGLTATRLIKKMTNPPRVIMLTMYDTLEYRNEAKAAGADGFISKTEFVNKIGSLLLSQRKTLH